jgi:hypothetical protein
MCNPSHNNNALVGAAMYAKAPTLMWGPGKLVDETVVKQQSVTDRSLSADSYGGIEYGWLVVVHRDVKPRGYK